MNLLYEYYTKTSHCVCLYIVLFCFCWVGFSCGFVRWNGLFLMKYLENENKSNQMNGTRNVLFCFVYSFVFLFSHKKSMIFKYFIGIVAMSQWVYKKKTENILTSWATYQIDVIHFYYANAILLDISVMIYIFSSQPQHI